MFGTYRTFLALMVVALHLGGVPSVGAYAVFGFYILSGYLMTLVMQTSYGYAPHGVCRYLVNRFLRIYPMYWISIAISFVLIMYFGESFSYAYHKSIYFPRDSVELLKNLLIFFPHGEPPRLTPPAWALTVELFFYVLIGLGISRNRRTVWVWLIGSVVYHLIALALRIGWQERYFSVFAASLPFSTGAYIYHNKEGWLRYLFKFKEKTVDFLPFVIGGGIMVNWLAGYVLGSAMTLFFYSNYLLCTFMVLVLSDRRSLPYISKRFDKLMGDYSYPIYLIHYQVGMCVVSGFALAGFTYKRPDLIIMIVSMPLIFVASWILILLIERPIEFVRSRVRRSRGEIGRRACQAVNNA